MNVKLAERKLLVIISITCGLLLCLRCISNVFIYPFLIVAAIPFCIAPFRVCLPLLFFLLPSANIIKLQPGQISLFTVFFLIYSVRVLFKKGALTQKFLTCLVFFVAYSFIFSGFEKFITIATMACGFVMLHEICISDDYNFEEVLYAFCFGLIVASVLGLFRETLPIVDRFVVEIHHKVNPGEYTERFCGLMSNPNYYSMDISVALSCLVVNITKGKNKLLTILFVVLSFFGLLSVSKSFLLVWAMMLIILVLYSIKNGGTSFLSIIIVLLVLCLCIYAFGQEMISTYIQRLESDADADATLSGITTGRSDVWFAYLKASVSDIKGLLFGNGLGNFLDSKAPHNTYIEALFNMGVIGLIIYFLLLKMSVNLEYYPKRILFYIPIIMMLVRFFGIGFFAHDNIWYYYSLACLTLKSSAVKKSHL